MRTLQLRDSNQTTVVDALQLNWIICLLFLFCFSPFFCIFVYSTLLLLVFIYYISWFFFCSSSCIQSSCVARVRACSFQTRVKRMSHPFGCFSLIVVVVVAVDTIRKCNVISFICMRRSQYDEQPYKYQKIIICTLISYYLQLLLTGTFPKKKNIEKTMWIFSAIK